ncbi:MAG: hypothetical protein J6Z11_05405 [Candidatus Riflebacteria bacterium]|nr:hypothetical protein [Candidatus Riflebacteria bacterium]
MKKFEAVLPILCLCMSTSCMADWLDSFDFSLRNKTPEYRSASIELPDTSQYEEPSVEDYNTAVTLNNQAIDAMNSNNNKEAVELFERAVSLCPGSKGFRKNYLIALNKAKKNKKLLEESLIVLGMEPEDHKTAYLMGLTYLNDLKDNETAADYFSYALNLSPEDSNYALALITSLENTGKYSDTVFELLKQYASKINEPYPFYLLGLKYLERDNYSKAIESFAASKKLDVKGYSYHAYVRAAFYGGKLQGLESIVKDTINRFPNDKNINSSKRVYASLKNSSFNLIEHITLNVSGASSLEELNFTVRPVANFHNHQKVEITSIDIISKGKKQAVTPNYDNDGALDISIPKSMWSPKISLEIKYNIELKALYDAFFDDGIKPDLDKLKSDEKFDLDDSKLVLLANYIDKIVLEDSDDLNSYQDIFIAKASAAVAKGLNYLENGVDNSVSWALNNSDKCDCTEYSRLLTALCLKKGIPARLVTGFLIKNELIGKETSIGHEWCEVYMDGRGWTPIDATLQSTMHRAYNKNLLNDQIFFEYPSQHERTRIGVHYTARNSDVAVSIENTYKITNYKK